MRAGKLDRRISIDEASAPKDSFGQPNPVAWIPWAVVWAEVNPESGQESLAAGAETQTQRTIFRIRYRAGIEPRFTILHNSRRYDIEDIAEVDRRRYLDIIAVAREVKAGE